MTAKRHSIKARAYADRALELDPTNADAYTHQVLGFLCWLKERYDEAVVRRQKSSPTGARLGRCG